MLLAAVGLFLVIRHVGENIAADRGATAAPPHPIGASHALFHVLLALLAIIVVGRLLGRIAVYVGQPRVIGEMIAGIVLGPSVLGRLSPAAMHAILPAEIAPLLGIVAQIGVILYMFVVGLELNLGQLRARAHATVAISHASIVTPFILGATIALWLYRPLAPAGVPFTSFALFMGVAMSITAFPVLARILTDRKIDATPLGIVALSCAAVDDVTAWCLLAFVVGIAQATVSGAVQTTLLAAAYVVVMVLVLRPMVVRNLRPGSSAERSPLLPAWVLIALLTSAVATEWIGIHAIFGAFVLGAIIPDDSTAAKRFEHNLEDIVKVLLLPAFFAYTGMRTEIGLLDSAHDWLVCAVIILVATAGKFGGTLVASRLTGLDWRMSAALGVLMNTRGLMELVVLNVGLELGVISPRLFAMMVVMALVTTIATTPILSLLVAGNESDARRAAA